MAWIEDESDRDDFKPCFETGDPMMVSLIKGFLESEEIPYFFTGEELLFLAGLAVPLNEACVTLFLRKEDIPTFQEFLHQE